MAPSGGLSRPVSGSPCPRAVGKVCAGKACRYADARAAGDRIVLPGAAAPGVTRVRYAWADAPFVNLFGGDGLPAAPFRLDVR